ncbi:MAG: ABC transporter ATP-binding protein [Candidatus Adiutrix sp.]|jgi:putative ABC transport system ATP-binding protein|nr:ABC transporter ATP-binding protein [Candidatus Adiutrix sp.]
MMRLQIQHLTKSYRRGETRFDAVHNISFSLDEGAFVSLVGRSGSGKTTLLNMAIGLLSPDSGEILADGVNLFSMDDQRRSDFRNEKIGYIPQGRSLLGNLTALDNARLPFHLKRRSGDSRQKARALFAALGLAHLENSYPAELSGGELRRVALARALINSPEIVIADEPTSDLDLEAAHGILELFAGLNAEGVGFLVATHDAELSRYGRPVLKMNSGQLTQATEPPGGGDSQEGRPEGTQAFLS